MRSGVLIVAAGRGRRFGDPLPKQYLPVAGICSLRRCLDRFLGLGSIGPVQVVIHPDDMPLYHEAIAGVSDSRLLPPVGGGETRAKSVTCGLRALEAQALDCVLVHDAARPFVSDRIIGDILAVLETGTAAFAALPIVDALWRVEEGAVLSPVAREGLWRAQTPQGFPFAPLLAAHLDYQGEAADDVQIARAMGMTVQVVTGAPENFKITSPGDLEEAERIVAQQG